MDLSKRKLVLLNQFLRWVSRPEPEDEGGWNQLESDLFWCYTHSLSNAPPLLLDQTTRERWARNVFHQVRTLWRDLEQEEAFSVPMEWGAQRFHVKAGRLAPFYVTRDPTSTMLFAFVTLLIALDDLTKIQRCRCGSLFYKVKRQRYCSDVCKEQAHPSRHRIKNHRARRVAWDSTREDLEGALEGIRSLRRTTRPQALAHAQKVLTKAEGAFRSAYPRRSGRGYEDGEEILTRAYAQIRGLRQRVKGY